MYKQCVLEKCLGKWQQRRTVWLPDCFTDAGKTLKNHLQRDFWDEGWVVIEVLTAPDKHTEEDEWQMWAEMPVV